MSCPHPIAEGANADECPFMADKKSKDAGVTEKDKQAQHVELVSIPQPPQHLFGLLGNLPDLDPSFPFKEIWRLQRMYGPIMKLNLDTERIFIGSQELVNEVCDQSRFQKAHLNVLEEVRAALHDGLFTAYNDEPNWGKAHRMLVPTFGPLGIRKMWDGMQDIASQMILKWDRLGPEHIIDSSDDLTRLAFDTIGLCAFSFRFNQFYSQDAHPFARQMSEVLWESGRKANRPSIMQPLYRSAEQERQSNVAAMHALCDEIVAERKAHPQPGNPDLLNIMLNNVDRETGEGLSTENIRYQLATFLVAGHETTSATLSFCYYHLVKNPDKYLKAQKQVDEVVGDAVLSLEHIPKLDYIDACIKETLRLTTTINGTTRASKTDQIIGGKYFIPAGTGVTWVNACLHRDPKVWGDDADQFRPERFLNGGFQSLPPNSWKPFGTGARACIGRTFAEQEMMMNVAMVLQRFQIELADPSYILELKSTLTIKPKNFHIRARRRPGKSVWSGIPGGVQQREQGREAPATVAPSLNATETGKPLRIFFGGNTGTCEALAQSLETKSKAYGFNPTIADLDAATEHLIGGPAVIITASYEGLPPDNAKKFVAWLESKSPAIKSTKDVKFAVFGVGNSDWASTYLRIPKLVNQLLKEADATTIVEPGYVNVKEDPVGPFEEWTDELLKRLSGDEKMVRPKSTVEVIIERQAAPPAEQGKEFTFATVVINRELAGKEAGLAKRHLEIQLPEDASYSAGDYLVVQPCNHSDDVQRVLSFFKLSGHDTFKVKGSAKKHLPTESTPIGDFLSGAVELASPITKRQLELITSHASGDRQHELEALVQGHSDLLAKRYSIVDVLESFALDLPFSEYVDMLPALTPRQYSISSSALKHPNTVSLTIDVHEAPAMSSNGMFHGVASTYLASRTIGSRILCYVRPTQVGFRLPPPDTPLIMIAAGTGIAPMRAFLEERASIAQAGAVALAPATLYFGCRHEAKDFIYQDQLREWQSMGIVTVKTAFSQMDMPQHPHQHVPDLIWEDREEVAQLFRNGAKIFLCGSAARLGQSTADVCKKIYSINNHKSAEEAETWLQSVKTVRYISDVY